MSVELGELEYTEIDNDTNDYNKDNDDDVDDHNYNYDDMC